MLTLILLGARLVNAAEQQRKVRHPCTPLQLGAAIEEQTTGPWEQRCQT